MTIDILCKVVDNLGDIGFVYRLARALSELPPFPRLRLIVDDLAAFAAICPQVESDFPMQMVEDWLVVRWDNPGSEALKRYFGERPRMVLECYACGRPPWFEAILFDEADKQRSTIVNLEYLTCESWACDFHRLPSLTRSPLVHKAIFMPGMQNGTGGLLQDSSFKALLDACSTPEGKHSLRHSVLAGLEADSINLREERDALSGKFWVFVFSYEHDFTRIVEDLAQFNAEHPVLVLLASGRSAEPFLNAWKSCGCPFSLITLPLLPQKKWDAFLVASDFTVVRGEETFARACLCGNPFLWQCYPFSESESGGNEGMSGGSVEFTGHLPKIKAFLELLQAYVPAGIFESYRQLTLHFNGFTENQDGTISSSACETEPGELLVILQALREGPETANIASSFRIFSQEVRNLGNLAENLLTFLQEIG